MRDAAYDRAYSREYRRTHPRLRTSEQRIRKTAQQRIRRRRGRAPPILLRRPYDVPREPAYGGVSLYGKPLTVADFRALAEVALHGTAKEASLCMGQSHQTVKNRVNIVLQKLGVERSLLAYAVIGWLAVPYRYLPRHRFEPEPAP